MPHDVGTQSQQLNAMKLDPTYLYTSSRKVKDIPSVIALYKDAAALMRKKNGVGLAANQVGYNLRWFVWQHGMVINPSIGACKKTIVSREGCLSFPGRTANVLRAPAINVRYTDERGKPQEKRLVGLPAIVFQHEFDHINGICLFPQSKKKL